MKQNLYIWILAFLTSGSVVLAQDVQRFSERHIMGSARYVGMGGAMTAIGGDPSAVLDNPAGLGLYRHSEIAVTVDETIDRTQQLESQDIYQRTRFAAPNVSAIWAWGNDNKQRGMIYNNFMFSINRLANYNRELFIEADRTGMLPAISLLTDGLEEQYLQNKPWDDSEIGWLSILAYEGYLINPLTDAKWTPALDMTTGKLSVSESGSADQYMFSWGSNINNQWYLGVSLNIPTLTYTKRISLYESDRINSAELKSLYHMSGLGFGGSIGLIYRPLQALRVGVAFQTPTMMELSVQTEGDMYSMVSGNAYEILTPASGVMNMRMIAPLRTSASVAGQITNRALIAIQYDYAHATDMEDVHTLRVGAEAQVYRSLYVNAGYIYESSFLHEEPIIGLDYNSVRTDMDYRYTHNSQYASVAIGYRNDVVVAHLAYQYRWEILHQYATEMQMLPVDVRTQTHRIVATLAWRF